MSDGYTLDGEAVAGSITEPAPSEPNCRDCPLRSALDFWADPGEDVYEGGEA